MSAPLLELYYYYSCPFCQIVLEVVKELNLQVELKDILANREDLNRLVRDTGRRTVPCLYIDGKPMFESRDIVKWLRDNKQNLKTKN
ncbi:MAG: glutaredoxin [Bdellovibrio sp. CG12_big_fil_rev_8_21_14_0_65_39_13]|nr:MAG: glutaredoxin [Bdellovibrio sp. CG22_combo_CG10-13_8_21_14_all_39_27]PIQ58162.1 MAG: glutaredoxin [Bdellovibrio sp. CG12_big_fil_rev_8_21_14_0_65_39_13]PIR34324.1 MAG: glutaredoxin [Bdellovibrio sp. CG11_big_fil_rev_8_21_14_0_20_39_38]PJB52223.1 MAG: glutaredoxin [Bdellovibrio sp. CG_4_9_14_3_um_filter_39_7]